MHTKSFALPFSLVLLLLCFSFPLRTMGQDAEQPAFKAYLINEEYGVFLNIDFTGEGITVPGQELFGSVPGYLGSQRDSRKWLITDAQLTGPSEARLSIVNDYGSEDLEAVLRRNADDTYTLKQGKGSRIKIVENRKWVKLPTELVLKPKNK